MIRQENQGAAAARNAAYAACSGDYIQWLDADDLLGTRTRSSSREGRARSLPQTRASCCRARAGMFHTRPERARFIRTPLWDDLSPVEFLRRKMQSGKHFMAIESWLVSRGSPRPRERGSSPCSRRRRRVFLSRAARRKPRAVRVGLPGSRSAIRSGRRESHRRLVRQDRGAASLVRATCRIPAVDAGQRGHAGGVPRLRAKVRGLCATDEARARATGAGIA